MPLATVLVCEGTKYSLVALYRQIWPSLLMLCLCIGSCSFIPFWKHGVTQAPVSMPSPGHTVMGSTPRGGHGQWATLSQQGL